MTVFGYARKDYPSQLVGQLTELMVYDCDQFFVENQNFSEQTELELLLKALKKEDTIIVTSLAVLGKRTKELTNFLTDLDEKKVRLISISDSIDTADTYSIASVALVLYRIDSECQSQHTKERLAISKSMGEKLGRPRLSQDKINQIKWLYQQKLNYREISKQCGVSLGSVHKYIQDEEIHNKG